MRNLKKIALALPVLVLSSPLLAAPAGTFDDLVAAVDWSDVGTAIVAIAALVAAVKVIMAGSRMVLRMIRG